MQQFLATKQIEWSNILAKAPWFGAIYERLIKTVKRCLKKTLKNSKVTVNELNTLLADIECMINNRPLKADFLSSQKLLATILFQKKLVK